MSDFWPTPPPIGAEVLYEWSLTSLPCRSAQLGVLTLAVVMVSFAVGIFIISGTLPVYPDNAMQVRGTSIKNIRTERGQFRENAEGLVVWDLYILQVSQPVAARNRRQPLIRWLYILDMSFMDALHQESRW